MRDEMMKRANTGVINGWQDGTSYPGVMFSHIDPVIVTAGLYRGETVCLITLEALEPEPHYLAEREDGSSFVAKQSELRKVDT